MRPLDELKASSDVVLIPPQDVDTAMWLLEKLDREADKLEAKLEKLRAKAAKEEAEVDAEGEGDDAEE